MPDLVVHVRRPLGWAETLHVHFWDRSPGGEASVWPGVPLAIGPDAWYSHRFRDTTSVRMVFNDGQGQQTGDLYRDRDGWLDEHDRWHDREPTEGDSPILPPPRAVPPQASGAQSLVPSLVPEQHGDFREETIYFLLTTRFYDGDPSNNFFCRDRIRFNDAGQPVDPHWRGDFKGLIRRLDYIRDLGFTAIWITPPVENRSGLDYHGYHPYDWTRVDPRLESADASYQDLIDAAHAKGVKIIQDVVINHSCQFGIRGKVHIDHLPVKYYVPHGSEQGRVDHLRDGL